MNRKKIIILFSILLIWGIKNSWSSSFGNATYGIYSETYEGLKIDPKDNPSDVEGGALCVWGDPKTKMPLLSDDHINVAEGGKSLKVDVLAGSNGGCWFQFGYDGASNPRVPTDMSAYSGGTLEFWIKTEVGVKIKIEWSGGSCEKLINDDLGIPLDNAWHYVSIPLSSFENINLSSIVSPAGFHAFYIVSPNTRTFWIDNVVWKKPVSGSLDIKLKQRSNDLEVSGPLTWSNIEPGCGWQMADQYIELNLTYSNTGWGIQIYTDNKANDANPKFSGTGDPGGLVDTQSTSNKLPMCWHITDAKTTDCHIRQGAPNASSRLWLQELGDSFPCFFWVKDRSTQNFAYSEDYITLWDNRGIQYAEAAWGGAMSPNYLYVGADFSNAVTPRTYTTNKFIIELFYE